MLTVLQWKKSPEIKTIRKWKPRAGGPKETLGSVRSKTWKPETVGRIDGAQAWEAKAGVGTG